MAVASILRGATAATASVRAVSQGLSSALCFGSPRKTVADVADVTSHKDALDFPIQENSKDPVNCYMCRWPLFSLNSQADFAFHRAALKAMSYLPLPYSALSALLVVPQPLRDAVYDHIAKKRYNWFGKEDKCLVMREQDMLDRFIDRG